jgi:hypothetical protein
VKFVLAVLNIAIIVIVVVVIVIVVMIIKGKKSARKALLSIGIYIARLFLKCKWRRSRFKSLKKKLSRLDVFARCSLTLRAHFASPC